MRVLAFGGLWLCIAAAGMAKPPPRVPSPPLAVPLRVNVTRGTTVEIPLRVYGDPGQSVIFELRRAPSFGKASEPRAAGRDAAILTYQQSDDGTHFSDRLTYVAKNGGGVSAPVEVSIRIVDPDSVFIAPEALEFGKVTIGEPASQVLTLANRGGGTVEGGLECSRPWSIKGDASYRLAEGARKEFTVLFNGTEEREYRGTVRYTSHPSQETDLSAKVEAPIALTPKPLELKFDPATQKRGASLQIANRGDQPRTVHLEKGERLIAPEAVELEAHGKQTIRVETAAGDIAAIDEKILLMTGRYLTELPVRGPAVGAILRSKERAISFGDVPSRLGATKEIAVENAGGERAFVHAELEPPFRVAAKDAAFTLERGSSRSVQVLMPPGTAAGGFRASLSLKAEETELILPVEARVLAPNAAAGAGGFSGSRNAATDAGQPETNTPLMILETAAGTDGPRLYGIANARVTELGTTTCEIAWSAVPDEKVRYQIEGRELSLEGKELKEKWVSLPTATLSRRAGEGFATIRGLAPDTSYLVRISAMDAAGNFVNRSAPLSIHTAKRAAIFTFMRVLFAGLALLMFFLWRARRTGSAETTPS